MLLKGNAHTSYIRIQIGNINKSLKGQVIARTSNQMFLGVLIDKKLKFDKHINKLCYKVPQSIRIMRRILHVVSVNVIRSLYYTLMYSRLTHAIGAWRSEFNSTTCRIESLIARTITFLTDHSKTIELERSP